MTGQMCPECGGELGSGHDAGTRPGGCACTAGAARRAGDAEDFDPLRIRPYVTLPGEDAPPGPDGPPPAYVAGPQSGVPDAASTMQLHTVGAATGPMPDVVASHRGGRRAAKAYAGSGPDPVQPRGRRPLAVIAVGVAVAAVVGTAAFASGLFGADGDAVEEALPETTTSAPDLSSSEPARTVSESPSASGSPSESASSSPSASASASASESPEAGPSASPNRTTASPSASLTADPTPTSAPPTQESVITLRQGDQGDEVAELQRRLHERGLYWGRTDGYYSHKVERGVAAYQSYMSIEGDPSGVYGPATRRVLEANTSGQGRY